MIFKLEVLNIKKSYGNLDTIDDVSLKIEPNSFVSILGPSGCGKSTLFDIISGIETPDKGKVLIDKKDYTAKTGIISYMQQKDLLFPWKNVLDNTCLPLLLRGINLNDAREKAESFFEVFGLKSFEKNYPKELSGGMKQRAALLRTYLFSSEIMLLDEPFGSLDAITRRRMQLWLLKIISHFNSSILFITHSVEEAIFLSDKIYLLSDRPSNVKEVFKIILDKPRDFKTFTSKEFIKIKEEILTKLMGDKREF